MTDDGTPLAGTEDARLLLQSAERALRDLLRAFEIWARRLDDGEAPNESDVARACILLSRIRNNLIEEIQKHERLVLAANGRLADAAIDFDDVRSEIRRRLDRLRPASPAG